MKLSVGFANGLILTYEGEPDELMEIGEKMVAEHGNDIINLEDAKKLGGQEIHVTANGQKFQSNPNSRRWSEHSVKKLLALLYGEQSKLLKFLVDRGGSANYAEIGKFMGYDAQHLSGILSPITRNAQAATGDKLARVIDWRPTESGVRGKRVYYVVPEALPLLKDAMKRP
jgi:hypothetical protein